MLLDGVPKEAVKRSTSMLVGWATVDGIGIVTMPSPLVQESCRRGYLRIIKR